MIATSLKERNVTFDFKDLNNDVLHIRKVISITKLSRPNKMDTYHIFPGVEHCRPVSGLPVDHYHCLTLHQHEYEPPRTSGRYRNC